MAFGGSGGAGKVKSDINVTPLVDVVLVLLIIFLVTMPIVMRDITIDIPRKSDDVQIQAPTDQTVVEVRCPTPDGQHSDCGAEGVAATILLNNNEVKLGDLAQKISDKLAHISEKVVFVDFDNNYPYRDAVTIMDTCKGAGATTIGIKMKDDAAAAPAAPQ
jgi:biopolymer transport protein ExbD